MIFIAAMHKKGECEDGKGIGGVGLLCIEGSEWELV